MIVHHGYFRSSSSYRCRIALGLKGIESDYRSIHLLKNGGEQKTPEFEALNPQKLVPAFEVGDTVLTQSPAILEWLDEVYPDPPLLPSDPFERAKVRAFCAVIGCDIHPLQNLRVLQYLEDTLGADGAAKTAWCRRWIGDGLQAAETLLEGRPTTKFAFSDQPGMAEVYLMPQVFSADRFEVDLSAMPRLREIAQACDALPEFITAHPSNQPDSV